MELYGTLFFHTTTFLLLRQFYYTGHMDALQAVTVSRKNKIVDMNGKMCYNLKQFRYIRLGNSNILKVKEIKAERMVSKNG